jgi:hypothetical protein
MTALFRTSIFLFFLALSGTPTFAQAQTCTQTLNPGANVASIVSSAPTGSTLCLNSGNYGTVNLNDIQRTGFVTVQSTSGQGAAMFVQLGNSRFIRLRSLTLNGGLQNSCSRNIEWIDNRVIDSITLTNSGCSGSLATVFNGNTFGAINVGGGYEGRLSLIYGSGITITNNTFGPGGASDGIFMGGNVANVTIGPGNVFTGILEANCGAVHCDAVQGYGAGSGVVIQGNLFEKGDTFIMMPDGSSGVVVRDNVFNGTGVSYPDKIQFGSATNPLFQHNTLVNVRASFDSKTGESASANALAENNLLTAGSSFKTSNGNGCSACTFRSNLTGTPQFVGGATPNTWAGFMLAPASTGYRAASDGKDMGATVFDANNSPPVAPAAPSNLTVR